MILFISEQQDNNQGMKKFVGMAVRAGEKCGLYTQHQHPEPEPSQFVMKHCEREPEEIAGFEAFRFGVQHQNYKCTRYGESQDEIIASAIPWYAHYIRLIENQIYHHGLDMVVTWGSSLIGNRAAILAAEDLGIPVRCIEDGWFRWMDDEGHSSTRTFVVTPDQAYYERVPDEWSQAFVNFEHDPDRLALYRDWWHGNRQTKYSGTKRHDLMVEDEVRLPAEWCENGGVVWFGQLYGDAATYWLTNGAQDELRAAAEAEGAWYKPHPFTQEINAPDGLRQLPQEASIHDILPDTEYLLCLTSNVGLEARMYDVPANVFGSPFYKRFPGEEGLDYIIHRLQFPGNDKERFVQMLRGVI